MIDDNYKCLVYGYIRKTFVEEYKISNIPSIIIDLLIVFSYLVFEWDLETKHENVVADNDTLSVKLASDTHIGNIYSKTILDVKAIYIFKIKVINHSCGIWGIVNQNQFANDGTVKNCTYALYAKDGHGYGGAFGYKYKTKGVTYKDYALKPGNNGESSVVEVTFNKIKGELSYKLGDENLGIAWDNIDIEKKYRFAAYISSHQESFQVIDFRIKWE